VLQGAQWSLEAERQHQTQKQLAAPRGGILDRDGVSLAVSHETFSIGIAPNEVTDRDTAIEKLSEALGVSKSQARRYVTSSRKWVTVPGRFGPTVREALQEIRGIHFARELRRFYPYDGLARGLLGAVIDEEGKGGIEQGFEEHLRGTPGAEMVARDSGGREIPGMTWVTASPRSGGSVVLTLDVGLQEIAHAALSSAVEEHDATGGDLIVLDPRTGEILAMVSLRDGESTHLGGINTPYEPGSTIKPFTVATLLREKKGSLQDSVATGNGRWTLHGRTITDVSPHGTVTVGRALQVSSNVGIAMAAQALSPEEQYEGLRDFGFGAPTGLGLPGEIGGRLPRPAQWSKQSAASLSYGYELQVTPLQMVMAYGALANGGVLMEPRIVKELRDESGRTIQRFEPQAVRRVIPREIAEEINAELVNAVRDGTGTRASLESFAVAGKSGTSRIYGPNGYEDGAYFASFVGFFPADAPQLVVYVKLDRPRGDGSRYGGATAAPVTRATLEAILATRSSPLDREALARIARAQQEEAMPVTAANLPEGELPALFTADRGREEETEAVKPALPAGTAIQLPDLSGLSPRVAARRLHDLGFAVTWDAPGVISGTRPDAGSRVLVGDTIRLLSSGTSSGEGR
jgi:cell division protein FtsI (penicillin-binding protein 3)